MKAITGAILIVAAALFFQARVDVASSQIGFVEAKELMRISHAASLLCGITGVLLIGIGVLPTKRLVRWIFSTGRLLPPAGRPDASCGADAHNPGTKPSVSRE